MPHICALLTLLTLIISSAIPVSAGSVDIVSDESWIVEGPYYIGKAVNTWVYPRWTSISGAHWIWRSYLAENQAIEESYMFVKEFYISGFPTFSFLYIAADDSFTIILNQSFIGANIFRNWEQAKGYDVLSKTIQGRNVLQVIVTNFAGKNSYENTAGLLFKLRVDFI